MKIIGERLALLDAYATVRIAVGLAMKKEYVPGEAATALLKQVAHRRVFAPRQAGSDLLYSRPFGAASLSPNTGPR